MVKYYFEGDTFVIEDYQNAKTFSSFLPGVAGEDGKPLWAFYATIGQVMAGFGVNDKNTPITPFDSANLAYQNIGLRSFRTFYRVNRDVYAPFAKKDATQTLRVDKAQIVISEQNDTFKTVITYSSVPHQNYAALIRKVEITNITSNSLDVEILDGLPIFFPNGLSNFAYKELVSLMAAYCEVHNKENNAPFIKFKTSTGDHAVVEESHSGNAYISIDTKGERLFPIFDLKYIFGNDEGLMEPLGFMNKTSQEFVSGEQQSENKMPCAFSYANKRLNPGETYSFYSLYGTFDDIHHFQKVYENLTAEKIETLIKDSNELIANLLAPLEVKTNDIRFDRYMKQTFLDNNLRGGFPILLPNANGGEVYYVYSRKHGDMERDYNQFSIPSKYYSSGPGNFRDVNQNRRNDLYFYPFVGDYNIKLFFNLIQVDGQNPLNVAPLHFIGLPEFSIEKISHHFNNRPLLNKVRELLATGFEPSEMFTLLKDNSELLNIDPTELFTIILGQSKQTIIANFAEGYWIDHWTYNVDLLLNYASVYPDKMRHLLLDNDYRYFYSLVRVEPRYEKYCLLPDGKIRQYGAIDLAKVRQDAEQRGQDLKKTAWLKDKEGNEIRATLAAKILNLITIKFATLDNEGLGVEMECEKPGWNDAMNGLPGLFASGVSETVELLRLTNFALTYFPLLKDENITLLNEQYKLLKGVEKHLKMLNKGEIDRFTYWDDVSTIREQFRASLIYNASGKTKEIKVTQVIRILNLFKKALDEALVRLRKIGNGILPTYLYYEVTKYEKNGCVNHLGYETVRALEFSRYELPPFLEANARVLKLGPKYNKRQTINKIKQTGIYDKQLGIYKTCADIDDEPFEIGRIHAFTKGWLERECNFLHMTYKYLLGLLKSGFVQEFYAEAEKNFVYLMDPHIYGRSPSENSSFIVPTCNPDKSNHGRGFFARLTGANAEMINIYTLMFFGDHLFSEQNGVLSFRLNPKIDKKLFNRAGEIKVKLFNTLTITYLNPHRFNYDDKYQLIYKIDGARYESINGPLANKLRNGEITQMEVEFIQ